MNPPADDPKNQLYHLRITNKETPSSRHRDANEYQNNPLPTQSWREKQVFPASGHWYAMNHPNQDTEMPIITEKYSKGPQKKMIFKTSVSCLVNGPDRSGSKRAWKKCIGLSTLDAKQRSYSHFCSRQLTKYLYWKRCLGPRRKY